MSNRTNPQDFTSPQHPPSDGDMPRIDLGETIRQAIAGVRRQKVMVAAATIVMTALGVAYVILATPVYTAQAAIIIDPRISNSPSEPSAPSLLLSDALIVDSEVQALQSRELTNRLIGRLGLMESADEEPAGLVAMLGEWVRSLLGDATPAEAAPSVDADSARLQAREAVRRNFIKQLEVVRSGETYVIDIAYTSADPVFAARVVNALVDEYLLMRAEEAFNETEHVADWLSTRVTLLGQEVEQADAAIAEYRREHGLFNVRGEILPVDAELSAANDQLIATRSEIVSVNAQLAEIRSALEMGSINPNLDETTRSTIYGQLLDRYTTVANQLRDLEARLGGEHRLVAQNREELERTESRILEELENIAERLESRRETLQRQVDRAEERIATLRSQTADAAEVSIRLRELERDAEVKRSLYATMLTDLTAKTQRQSFKPAAARIIAKAVPPDQKSAPNSKLIVVLSAFAGLVLGGGGAFVREALDDTFRRASDVEDLGTYLIGVVPVFDEERRHLKRQSAADMSLLPPGVHEGMTQAEKTLRFAVDHPSSLFAETLRSLSISMRRDPIQRTGATVIGITSMRRGEGKTTLAGNLAAMQSARGRKVAVVDLDLRRAVLSRTLQSLPEQNRLGVLLDNPERVAALEPNRVLRGAHMISGVDRIGLEFSDAASMHALETLMARLRADYDVVVCDLAPVGVLADVRAATQLLDTVVLAIEWGQTRKQQAVRVLRPDHAIHAHLAGAVYTKVRLDKYALYDGVSWPNNYYV